MGGPRPWQVKDRQAIWTELTWRSFIEGREKGSSERPPGKRKREVGRNRGKKEEGEEDKEIGRVLPFKEGTACPVLRQA